MCVCILILFNNFYISNSVDIVPISKDSIVCLPRKLTQQLGGISPICLIYKITNSVHLIDVSSGQSKSK